MSSPSFCCQQPAVATGAPWSECFYGDVEILGWETPPEPDCTATNLTQGREWETEIQYLYSLSVSLSLSLSPSLPFPLSLSLSLSRSKQGKGFRNTQTHTAYFSESVRSFHPDPDCSRLWWCPGHSPAVLHLLAGCSLSLHRPLASWRQFSRWAPVPGRGTHPALVLSSRTVELSERHVLHAAPDYLCLCLVLLQHACHVSAKDRPVITNTNRPLQLLLHLNGKTRHSRHNIHVPFGETAAHCLYPYKANQSMNNNDNLPCLRSKGWK